MRKRLTRTRRALGWPAGVVSILLLAALVLMTAVAFVPDSGLSGSRAAEYAAAPGTAQRLHLGETQQPATAEFGVLTGNSVALAVPRNVLRSVRPIGRPAAVRWHREVLSPFASAPSGPVAAPQVTLRSVTDIGISLHALYGNQLLALEPALLELPADVAAGRQWSSTGRAVGPSGTGEYRNTATARAAENGCLLIESTTVLHLGEQTRRTDTATWCPRRGVVSGTPTLGLERRQAAWAGALQPSAPGTGAPSAAPGTSGEPPVVVQSVNGGTESWAPRVGPNAVVALTADGSILSTSQTTRELAAHRLAGDSLCGYWWGMPPGLVQGMSVNGNTVLVTTSDRQLVAYTSSGARLWSHRLRDIAPAGAVPLGEHAVVVGTVAGDLEAYDLADGEPLWRAEVPDGVTGRSQVIGGTVYTGRKNNAGIAAIDATTGRVRWVNDDMGFDLIGFARDGGTLLVGSAPGSLLRVDDATGKSLSTEVAGFGSQPKRLLTGGDPGVSALQTRDEVLLLATATGTPFAELPGALDVVAADRGWWVREQDALRLLDPRGHELTRVPLPEGVPQDARIQPAADRIWLIGNREGDLHAVWVSRP